ncbi:prepilin-type N-terminal cleavage/methylation domain-containing protein [Campylobacter sp. MG1]|uniref:prepilin-type N-terminal cleavage/methylation domain-containing protein n=1 Tax=Campylobacter sp. MG1 TaxID=2976332 RepID=UPI00226CB981|nr:prepilin-type N-terminal cleavage/methylation domain-containing protein [Campylobacter sp. MG1]
MKKAMSMMEIIFVIVIIGILSGVAIPKLFISRTDAEILKLQETVALIRVGIEAYANDELYASGVKKYPDSLCTDSAGAVAKSCQNNFNKGRFFTAVLQNSVEYGSKKGTWNGWTTAKPERFIYYVNNNKEGFEFTYDASNGLFKCEKDYNKDLTCAIFDK